MAKTLTGPQFAKALEAAGVISDLDAITRIIIDVQPADLVKIYVERVGDDRLPGVAAMLAKGGAT